MEAENAGRYRQASSAAPADGEPAVSTAPSWYRRVTFWRSVAGMAFALAIASAAVTGEFSSALIERTRHFHFRMRELSSNISAMRTEIVRADREIEGMRTAAEVDDALKRIIAEPDSRVIRLEAPGRAIRPSGVIAFSPRLRRAAIDIDDLPALPDGGAYVVWWTCGKHAALRATELNRLSADQAATVIALPAGDKIIEGAIVTAESKVAKLPGSRAQTASDPVLIGMVSSSRARPEISRHKGG